LQEIRLTLANRLTRLDKQITDKERQGFKELAQGKTISQVVNLKCTQSPRTTHRFVETG
jgi:hypothetical protein